MTARRVRCRRTTAAPSPRPARQMSHAEGKRSRRPGFTPVFRRFELIAEIRPPTAFTVHPFLPRCETGPRWSFRPISEKGPGGRVSPRSSGGSNSSQRFAPRLPLRYILSCPGAKQGRDGLSVRDLTAQGHPFGLPERNSYRPDLLVLLGICLPLGQTRGQKEVDRLVEDPGGRVENPEGLEGIRPKAGLLGEFAASARRRILPGSKTPRGQLQQAGADSRAQLPDQRDRAVVMQWQDADPPGVSHDLEEVPPLGAELHLHLFHLHHP